MSVESTSVAEASSSSLAADKYRRHQKDTGSTEVQIALLTGRIAYLTKHFEKHKKDNHSQRGMMLLISRRKRLLKYLMEKDIAKYRETIAALGLRK